MKRSSFLGTIVLLAFAATPALGQVQTRDHRKRPAPPPPPPANEHVKAHMAAPTVTGISPAMGAPGTTVTVTGTALRGVQVMVGGQPAAVTAQTPTSITFTVPANAQPGMRPVVLRRGRTATPAGRFRVQAVAVRDHRGDHDRDRDHRGPNEHAAEPAPPARQVAPPPPGAPPMRRAPGMRPNQNVRAQRRGHRNRTRVVVSGFWPRQGRPGTKVIIRGENFANGTAVLLGDTELTGARVSPNQIEVAIPRRATAGMLTLRAPGAHRAFAVGSFEVTAKAPPKRPVWRTDAEKRWTERRRHFAKSEAERLAALQAEEAQLAATREQRRQERIAARRAKFEADFLAAPDTVVELELHADRMARLQRMLRLASADDMKGIGVRVEIAIARENSRHDMRMNDLRAAFGK